MKRYFSTFKTLVSLADLNAPAPIDPPAPVPDAPPAPPAPSAPVAAPVDLPPPPPLAAHRKSEYHYNIQIHLPVTTDITVYNAIFRSLRENLGV
ncbi:hypothetical protein D9M68_638570 [compost metagenome]